MAQEVKLKVIAEYRSQDTRYQEGQVIGVSVETARFLMADAPLCFAPVEKEMPAPPVDKMIKKGKAKTK